MQIAFFFCMVFLLIFTRAKSQHQCQTPNELTGECIPILQCPTLLKLLTGSLSDEDRNFLRNSQCGYDFNARKPFVCCPMAFTTSDLPVPGVCGAQTTYRIVGGENTSIFEYPWMALLEFTSRNCDSILTASRIGFSCGGVLINENYVLTAAHCLTAPSHVVSVRLGEHNLLTEFDCEDGECADPVVDVPIAERILHEDYDQRPHVQANDIALIRLSFPVRFTDYIKPICLPISQSQRSKVFDHIPLTVIGFGRMENGRRSNIKKKLDVVGQNLNKCNEVYRNKSRLDSSQICAGGERGEDSCPGDSGGPLIIEDRSNPINPYYSLVGLVSFGNTQCGTPGWPGVYTKVGAHMDWILRHMRK